MPGSPRGQSPVTGMTVTNAAAVAGLPTAESSTENDFFGDELMDKNSNWEWQKWVAEGATKGAVAAVVGATVMGLIGLCVAGPPGAAAGAKLAGAAGAASSIIPT